jgi:hypothetical protein
MVIPMKQYEQQHCLVDLVFGWDCRAISDSTHFGLTENTLTDEPVTPAAYSHPRGVFDWLIIIP